MNIVVDEDQSVDLTLLSFDPEGDDVSYSYSMPNYGHQLRCCRNNLLRMTILKCIDAENSKLEKTNVQTL